MSVQDMTLRYFVLLISVFDKFAKEEVYMRHLFLALLCVIMIFNTYGLSSVVNYWNKDIDSTDCFSIMIKCEDESIDLSIVEVQIFLAEITFEDKNAEYEVYSEKYAYSVYPNASGEILINRPAEYFSISINLKTLPLGYGIDNHTYFFFPNDNGYCATLNKIADVSILQENEDIIPFICDNHGNQIFTDVCFGEVPSAKKYCIDDLGCQILLEREYQVIVQGKPYCISKEITLPYANDYEKNELFYKFGLITRHEYVNNICTYMLYPEMYSASSHLDGTALYWEIRNYLDSIDVKTRDCSFIENVYYSFFPETITEDDNPSRDDSFVVSNGGYFKVWYDANSISAAKASAVANAFDSVDSLFCSSWGFLRPYYQPNSTYYNVYIKNITPSGETPRNGTYGSYINISYDTANHIYSIDPYSAYPNQYMGIIAHEYMHAIFYRYGIFYDSDDRKWMHECFSRWAGIAFEGDYIAKTVNDVNVFMATTYEPLPYFSSLYSSRHYGSLVFPLYIQQQLGGYNTIKKILSYYSASNDPLTAINAGLVYYNHSLAEAYSGCAAFNYSPSYFYSGIPGVWNSAYTIMITSYPYYSSSSSIKKLACHYYRCNSVGNNGQTLSITIDFTSIPSGAVPVVKTIRETSNGTKYISNCTISSNRCTIVQYNFGNSNSASMTFIPMNAGVSSGNIMYTKTVTLQ